MHFVDECSLIVEAGDGGNGAIAFRREKSVPFGGPAGGDGGDGGNVVFEGDGGLGTLHDITHQRAVRAHRGQDGMGKDCYGRAGEDVVVRLPLGTVAFDEATGERLFEVTQARRANHRGPGRTRRARQQALRDVDRPGAAPGDPGHARGRSDAFASSSR